MPLDAICLSALTSELSDKAGFSANILTRLRRDQYVSLESIEKICLTLDCKVDDILEFNQQLSREGN